MTFFGKIEKVELVEKKTKNKDNNGQPQWSLAKGFSEAPGPRCFFRKIRKNKPRLFSEGALCAAVVGKIKKIEIVEKMSKKKSTTVIHGGHSTQSLTKTESTFTKVEHKGWRRWSREALLQ